jgi:DNA-binding transcriptional LysR family regulator
MDRLDAMQVLLAVVDEGSHSAGSRKLRAPLPSVSRKVAELERHLGTRLLIRTSRNIQLTDAGRDYVNAVREIIAQIGDAELRAAGEYQVPRGELRITLPPELGRHVVLPLVYEFLGEHDEITLDIISANRNLDLIEEHVDIGVRLGHLPDSSFFAVKVGEIRNMTCASPEYLGRNGYPATPEDLLRHDAVQFGNFNVARLAWSDRSGGGEGAQMHIRVRANDVLASCIAARSGLGITRTSNYVIEDELRSGALVEILKDYASEPLPVHLIYAKQGLLPLKVRAFLDWMTPRLRKKLLDLQTLAA